MVNAKGKNGRLSTKAALLGILRERGGKPVSGGKLAAALGVSRVAVWKAAQSLSKAGYPVEAARAASGARPEEAGYSLAPDAPADFLYPWEFGEGEPMFRHYQSADSTMDRMRECAAQGAPGGTVAIAEMQGAGRGRCGRGWVSEPGGLYFTVLERPPASAPIALADYRLPLMACQIAAARAIGSLCGKPALLRWPNDVYVGGRKIAGLVAELAGEGDSISWLAIGIGINVNNAAPAIGGAGGGADGGGAVSCAEIAGRPVSRRRLLLAALDEARLIRLRAGLGCSRERGSRLLADEWNSMSDQIGARASLVDFGFGVGFAGAGLASQGFGQGFAGADSAGAGSAGPGERRFFGGRAIASGVFAGVDPSGRCVIAGEGGEERRFDAGPASLVCRPGPPREARAPDLRGGNMRLGGFAREENTQEENMREGNGQASGAGEREGAAKRAESGGPAAREAAWQGAGSGGAGERGAAGQGDGSRGAEAHGAAPESSAPESAAPLGAGVKGALGREAAGAEGGPPEPGQAPGGRHGPGGGRRKAVASLAFASMFAALISAGAFMTVPIGIVSITLQNMFVLLAGLALGPFLGAAAVALFLAAGALGAPVFPGGAAGIAALLGPTGGYFLGYLIGAFAAGLIAGPPRRNSGARMPRMALAAAAGLMLVYVPGLLRLGFFVDGWRQVLIAGFFPFIAGDALKGVAAAAMAPRIRRAAAQLLSR